MEKVSSRIDLVLRVCVPSLTALLAVLLSIIPFGFPHSGAITPSFLLVVTFYWGLYKPEYFPLLIACAIALFQDVLNGEYMGYNVLQVVLVYATVFQQKRFLIGKPFAFIWFSFSIMMVFIGVIVTLLNVSFFSNQVEFQSVIFKMMFTIMIYPLIGWLLSKCHKTILKDDEVE